MYDRVRKMKKPILVVVFILSITCITVVARSYPPHYLSYLASEDSQMKIEINNSLDYMMKNSQDSLSNPMLLSLWVMSKSFLGRFDNRTEVINYLDSEQEPDGAWSGPFSRMFTTQRVLTAYYLLNATPAHSLEEFFSNYDTWNEAGNYLPLYGTTNMYHVIFAWVLYYWDYPPWINDFFNTVEADLSWTTGSDFHKRTHILYSYVIARRAFPNLDAIIDTTLAEQESDGHWDGSQYGFGSPVYFTSLQVSLFSEILSLYPGQRTAEIHASLDSTKTWTNSSYHTTLLEGKLCGYFGDALSLENAIFAGLLCAGQTGLISANIDMTFQSLVDAIPEFTSISLIFLLMSVSVIVLLLKKKKLPRDWEGDEIV